LVATGKAELASDAPADDDFYNIAFNGPSVDAEDFDADLLAPPDAPLDDLLPPPPAWLLLAAPAPGSDDFRERLGPPPYDYDCWLAVKSESPSWLKSTMEDIIPAPAEFRSVL